MTTIYYEVDRDRYVARDGLFRVVIARFDLIESDLHAKVVLQTKIEWERRWHREFNLLMEMV